MSNELEAAINITAATNAKEAVLTYTGSAAPALAKGDFVLVTKSGWTLLLNSVQVVKAIDTTAKTITLAQFDTSDTNDFAAGGIGDATTPAQIQKIKSWVDLPLVTNVAVGGGDSQTTSFQPIQMNKAIDLFTTKNAVTQTFTFTHDSGDAIRPIIKKADKKQSFVGVKFYNPRASETRLYGAQVSFQEIPSATVNEVETVTAVFSLQSDMLFIKDADMPKP